ncbi:MAG: hypothetical protein WBW04_00155 [Nitrolancea sp.]
MIEGKDIDELVKLLKRRGVKLYHACQLTDFESYLSVGGIPSREHLESNGYPFTAFHTDQGDDDKGVWDKVFLNLSDFGRTFALGGRGVPNPYGPILFVLRPEALYEVSDVAICLRSAGALDFSREKEALKTVADVERLFLNSDGGAYVKYASELRKEFCLEDAHDPEVSCSVGSGRLSIEHTSLIRVDPCVAQHASLLDRVMGFLDYQGYDCHVSKRSYKQGRQELLSELIAVLLNDPPPSFEELTRLENCSNALREWTEVLRDRKLGWNFDRYAQYLRSGTLIPLVSAH